MGGGVGPTPGPSDFLALCPVLPVLPCSIDTLLPHSPESPHDYPIALREIAEQEANSPLRPTLPVTPPSCTFQQLP